MGMVQHTEAGFRAGTFETFMNPANQVSAFFSVGEDGTTHQYLPVGRGFVAFAQAAGNSRWYSCECEDKLNPGTPMTDIQVTTVAQIYSALAEHDGFEYAITDDPHNGNGLITHGDGKDAWGGHPDCPGKVRTAQRPEILARARAVRDGLDVWIGQGQKSLADLARDSLKDPVHQVLQLTAEYSPKRLVRPRSGRLPQRCLRPRHASRPGRRRPVLPQARRRRDPAHQSRRPDAPGYRPGPPRPVLGNRAGHRRAFARRQVR
jgi:hypothetical protein